jgi:hypothetical protein
MAPRPWQPAVELDGALERGDPPYAITLAKELADERGKPIDLATAAASFRWLQSLTTTSTPTPRDGSPDGSERLRGPLSS